MAKVHQPSKEGDSEDFVIRLDPREWDGTFSGEGKGPNDGYDDHTIRLDPREWDGTFSGEGKGPNDGYDDDHTIRLDPREWDGTFSGEGKGPNDGYDDDHTIHLDPREWDGTFSGEGKGPNDGYDDDHIIRLDPREWEGFEPAQPAAKPILESKAFDGDELLSRAFGEADPLDSSAGLSSDNATYSSNGTGSSALDTIHDLAEASIFKL